MNVKTARVMALGILTCANAPGWSYEAETHRLMSIAAVNNSVLTPNCGAQNQPACFLPRLGLQFPVDDPALAHGFPNAVIPVDSGNQIQSGLRSVIDLIGDGAKYEDSCGRSVNHFFDPVSGKGLNPYPLTNYASPDWALEDTETVQTPSFAHSFSYAAAVNYLSAALTTTDKTARATYWGLLFQSLGQVIHHVQDMAQPQHVRNDSHWDGTIVVPYTCVTFKLPGGTQGNPLYHESLFEYYTGEVAALNGLGVLNAPYTTDYAALDPTVFTTGRSYWINGGKGIAEFTNSNFFSAGTISSNPYPSPAVDTTIVETDDVQTLCQNANPVCPTNLTGKMTFYGTHITDQNTGATGVNSRAVTNSIFSADLQAIGTFQQLFFTLNRFDFDYAHGYLIPRAVEYSAALINHFFRGRMTISLPNEGVYAAIDHTLDVNSDPTVGGGFPTVRLKVQNLTQDGLNGSGQPIIEPMNVQGQPVGQLTAIAKYHLNNCYTASLSGEYGSPGIQWGSCRDPAESVSVSSSIPVPSGIDSSPQEVTFTFPNRIPIQATDLFLQVVYQGPLGSESNAIVVATKDISEPIYIYNFYRWDQFTYCSTYPALNFTGCSNPISYAQWCASGFTSQSDCNQAMSYTFKLFYSPTASPVPGFDPNNPATPAQNTLLPLSQEPAITAPLVVMPAPVGTYARVALLMDPNPQNVGVLVEEAIDTEHNTAQFQWYQINPLFSMVNQCSPYANNACNEVIQGQTQTMTISRTYAPARTATNPSIYAISNDGTPGQTDDATLLNQGSANPMPPITPNQSTVNF